MPVNYLPKTDFDEKVQGTSTEVLLQAFQGMRNPWKQTHQLAPEGQQFVAEELARRGIPVDQIQVTPGGKVERNTGLKSVGKAVGGVLKTIAPAAALIPGIGIPAAAALAAGGRALGGALSGDRFNLGSTIAAGAMGGAGKALTGLGRIGGGIPGAAIDTASEGALRSGGGGIGGMLGNVGGGILDFIKKDPERALRLGLGGMGAIGAAKAQGRANDLTNRALAPLGGVNPYASLADDPGNPYSRRAARPSGQHALSMELMR